MGNTVAALSGRKRFLDLRTKPLRFNVTHDVEILISDDGRTARLGLVDGEGRCYSNRTLRTDEVVRIIVKGSGFFDLGLTDRHPVASNRDKEFIHKYIVSKVLYFEPVELRLRIDPDGNAFFTDGAEAEVKLMLGARASSHWLAMKLGCGEVKATLLTENEEVESTPSVSDTSMEYSYCEVDGR